MSLCAMIGSCAMAEQLAHVGERLRVGLHRARLPARDVVPALRAIVVPLARWSSSSRTLANVSAPACTAPA